MKNIRIFYLKIFIFFVMKFSVYLNRHVFVMRHKPVLLARNLALNSDAAQVTMLYVRSAWDPPLTREILTYITPVDFNLES